MSLLNLMRGKAVNLKVIPVEVNLLMGPEYQAFEETSNYKRMAFDGCCGDNRCFGERQ